MPYPVSLNIKDRLCVVVGGGNVAARRVQGLIDSGAKVRVVAPEINQALMSLADNGQIDWRESSYHVNQIAGAFLVIAATNDQEVNEAIGIDAKSNGILISRPDSYENGDFITLAAVKRGNLCIAISTDGSSPTLTTVIKHQIEEMYGSEWAEWTELFAKLRPELQKRPDESNRVELVNQILTNQTVKSLIVQAELDSAVTEAYKCL